MYIRDDEDAEDFHFRLHKKQKSPEGEDSDENRVDQRKEEDTPDLDSLLNDADSTAQTGEGETIEI